MNSFNLHRRLESGYDLYVGDPVVEQGLTQQDILEMSSLAFEGPMRYGLDRDIRRNHIVVVDEDRVIGSVYVHPRTYVGPGFEVKSYGIGAVSVHPEYQGQGIMSAMMQTTLEMCREEGVAFMSLGGQRQRYQTFGFDNASPHPEYVFIHRNFRGIEPIDPSRIETVKTQDVKSYDALESLFQIYQEHTRITCRASIDEFARSLPQWGSDIIVIRSKEGDVTGYLRVQQHQRDDDGPQVLSIDEMNLELEDVIPLFASLASNARLEVVVRDEQVDLNHLLETYTEGSCLRHRIKACFTNCEQCLKLALAQYPYKPPEYERELRTVNALGETEVFLVPAQCPGESIELTYAQFRALFSVQTRFEVKLNVQNALGSMLPFTLPDLHADQD